MGRTGLRSALVCCIALTFTVLSASAVSAHQTKSNKGVSVTTHVVPEDKPVSGTSSKITISVKPKTGRFSWSSCKCYLRITDSGGDVVLNRKAKRNMRFTFPRATAYQLVVSGRVKRESSFKRFRVAFAIRAS